MSVSARRSRSDIIAYGIWRNLPNKPFWDICRIRCWTPLWTTVFHVNRKDSQVGLKFRKQTCKSQVDLRVGWVDRVSDPLTTLFWRGIVLWKYGLRKKNDILILWLLLNNKVCTVQDCGLAIRFSLFAVDARVRVRSCAPNREAQSLSQGRSEPSSLISGSFIC